MTRARIYTYIYKHTDLICRIITYIIIDLIAGARGASRASSLVAIMTRPAADEELYTAAEGLKVARAVQRAKSLPRLPILFILGALNCSFPIAEAYIIHYMRQCIILARILYVTANSRHI